MAIKPPVPLGFSAWQGRLPRHLYRPAGGLLEGHGKRPQRPFQARRNAPGRDL